MIRRPPRSTPLSLHDALPIWSPQPAIAMTKLFGTDGVRGVAGEFLTADLAVALGRAATAASPAEIRSEEHTSELQSQSNLVCRLLLEKKTTYQTDRPPV